MMLRASRTEAQALYYPEEEEALEERKKMKERRKKNRSDSCPLPKAYTNITGNPREQPLPKARHREAQEGSYLLMSRSIPRKGLLFLLLNPKNKLKKKQFSCDIPGPR